ncbi:GtrA family protein [Butyricicoccus faecihominis]|uniref:GtrA family protein n=1 Tax=Butyricicoccus faecihominis TaxID=1712515 RepID=UPI00247983B6|nr:GtrA family protein [Butyricicoccus faecihominis]MCQ5128033.1 GtrA family protein [Butyricicoccus faecihominis]
MKKLKDSLPIMLSARLGKTAWQFVKFGIVGLSNTIISLGVYWLCFYGLHWHYQISNLIGFIISVTNAYYWNSKYVFMNTRQVGLSAQIVAYFKVFLSYGGTYLFGVALLYVWVEKLGISEGIAPIINLIITIPLNFLLNKLWAFRK